MWIFIKYVLAKYVFKEAIDPSVWRHESIMHGDHILIRVFAVIFISTQIVINVHAGEYVLCEILICLMGRRSTLECCVPVGTECCCGLSTGC